MNVVSACLLLSLPLLIVALGAMMRYVQTSPNAWVGYRTRRSRQSQEAWRYAQQAAGRLWMALGMGLLAVSAAVCVIWFERLAVLMMYGVLGQTVCLLATIPLIEHALKKKFESQ